MRSVNVANPLLSSSLVVLIAVCCSCVGSWLPSLSLTTDNARMTFTNNHSRPTSLVFLFILFWCCHNATTLFGVTSAFSTLRQYATHIGCHPLFRLAVIGSNMAGPFQAAAAQQQQQKKEKTLLAATNNKKEQQPQRPDNDAENGDDDECRSRLSAAAAGRLEELKKQEAALVAQLEMVRRDKWDALKSRPLTMGLVGFGRFGQFLARTLSKHGRVVVTSRTDYTDLAWGMGVTYVPLSDPEAFLAHDLDVIIFGVSIMSFEATIQRFRPHLEKYLQRRREAASLVEANNGNDNKCGDVGSKQASVVHGPLIVDVLSVKEHARQVMVDELPQECDILCTHPMFGPDSGKDGWQGLNFVYEKTRIDRVILDTVRSHHYDKHDLAAASGATATISSSPLLHHASAEDEIRQGHIEGVDRMERFLSIWEEEGCRMVPMSCREHDAYAANSQFITHLMGRILGAQGLAETPIDTSGFQSVLRLVDSTTADSFDLFYGLYKYNGNSLATIGHLKSALDDVVSRLKEKEEQELQKAA